MERSEDPQVFKAGDDQRAKQVVMRLVDELGFDPVDGPQPRIEFFAKWMADGYQP